MMNMSAHKVTRLRSCLSMLCLTLLVFALPQGSLAEKTGNSPASAESASLGQLGKIEFPATGSPEAHAHFLRGVAALHSFWYEEAIESFQRATAIDPGFAMGYWGEAMAHHHPIWNEANMEAARKALQKVGDTSFLTERERQYLQAVRTLFGEGTKLAREEAYAAEMEQIAGAYREDLEATCFYALSLLGLATNYQDKPDIQNKYRVQAGALTLGVYGVNPDHPCAAHYTIHAFDDPVHAILALPQARRYAKIAPESHHARHMPAHIFVQLGMWEEAAASNKDGWESSVEWVKEEQLPLALRDYHSLYWLLYVYLQQGRYNDAVAVLLDKQQDMVQAKSDEQTQVLGYDRRVSRNYDSMVAAYIVETQRWDQADKTWEVDGYRFGDEYPHQTTYVRELADSMEKLGNLSMVKQTPSNDLPDLSRTVANGQESAASQIWKLQLKGVRHVIDGDHDQAIEAFDEAVALEESLPPPSGPPDRIKPTHELYGEMLLLMNRPDEAQKQFERALLWHANRARALLGLGRAAARNRDLQAARHAYGTLLHIWKHADPDLRELQEAKQFLQQTSQQ